MPIDYSKYPSDWKEISKQIRERAQNHCECLGECGVEHGGRCGVKNGALVPRSRARVTKIILTVAHMNHTPRDCRPENLRAMCQACHLRYDNDFHKKNAAKTRYRKKVSAGQRELIEQTEKETVSRAGLETI